MSAPVKMTPVESSSNVSAIGYADGVLLVQFRGGETYRYENVPEEAYEALIVAPSKGSYLARFIARNPTYPYRKLTPDEQRDLDAAGAYAHAE